jgi:serine/threonine protein kinase
LYFLFYTLFVLDLITRYIADGGAAIVYEAEWVEKSKKIAVKVFKAVFNKSGIDREISIGFEKRIDSEYTLNYQDKFIADNFLCVTMELMETSLDRFIGIHPDTSYPKVFLKEDVFFILFF